MNDMDWDLIRESNRTIHLLLEQAQVHERNPQPCVGLPFCVSCRAATLLKNDMDTTTAEAWISSQEPGTVVRW